MSEESIFIPINSISEPACNWVLSCFGERGIFRVIDQQNIGDVFSCTYAFADSNRIDWPEDFFVSLKQQEVYLCFYSATGQQRESVIQLLTKCLAEVGAEGRFEEL